MDTDSLNQALKKLADYLARRSYTKKELQIKLSRIFSQDLVTQALKKAQDNCWLESDQDLSQKLLSNLNQKQKSWNYIKQYFYKKGLTLPKYDQDQEIKKAKYWINKKYLDTKTRSKECKQKCKQLLAYKQFELDVIISALDETW